MSDDGNKNIYSDNNLISTDIIDSPLLIVLDEDDDDDDDDEYQNVDLTATTATNSNHILLNHKDKQTIVSNEISAKGKQSKVEVKNLNESLSINSSNKSTKFYHSLKSSDELEKSNKFPRTIINDKSFVQQRTNQPQRTKSISKHKNISSSNSSIDDHSIYSILSYISFDNISNILTVSRMGSIYYCVEDLYMKVFSTLCILDNLINLLVKPEIVILKQVTLSEKISIEEECSKLKKFNQTRYRLLSINSSDYLLKLKQLLLINKNEKNMEKIIDEMRRFKRIQPPTQSNDKVSSLMSKKRLSTDDVPEKCKRLKNVTNEQDSNKKVPSSTMVTIDSGTILKPKLVIEEPNNDQFKFKQNSNNSLTQRPPDNSETCSTPFIENILLKQHTLDVYNINTSDSSASEHSFSISSPPLQPIPSSNYSHWSKSFNYNQEEDNIMLKQKSIDSIESNYSMPMIVNVEENVEIDKQNVKSPEQSLSYSQPSLISRQSSSNDTIPYMPTRRSTSIHHPYPYRPSYYRLTPLQSPYNLYHQQSYPMSTSYENSKELCSINHDNQSSNKTSPPTIMPYVQKSNYYNLSPNELSRSCHSLDCSRQETTGKSSTVEQPLSKLRVSTAIHPDERMICRQYTIPSSLRRDSAQTAGCSKQYSLINRKERRIESAPYQSPKTFFSTPSARHPYSQNPLINEIRHKIDDHRSTHPLSLKNSSTLISPPITPTALTLPNICTTSIDLSQAIVEHGNCNMDKIPKLIVRHKKTYLHKTIDTMGQLFPTWFNEPCYRCIHCFTCDRVFTPQQFMTHIDDKQLANEQPINLTSIQLLTSEKMSKYKIDLWNQFCSNLVVYASKFVEEEEKAEYKKNDQRTGRIDGFSICGNLLR